MYALEKQKIDRVSGGVIGIMEAIGVAVCLYEAANILYQIGKGVDDGYHHEDNSGAKKCS